MRTGFNGRRVGLVVVVAGMAALTLSGCGGANERRASNTAAAPAGAPASPAPGAVVTTPAPTPPTKPADPKCAPLANFQLLNYSARTFDAKKFPGAEKDNLFKSLDEAATQAATTIPELTIALKVVKEDAKAVVNGTKYTPAAGEPTAEEAGKQLFDWGKDKNCT